MDQKQFIVYVGLPSKIAQQYFFVAVLTLLASGMYSAEVLQQAAHQHGIALLAVNPNRIEAATRTMFQGWHAQQFSDAILRSMVVFQ